MVPCAYAWPTGSPAASAACVLGGGPVAPAGPLRRDRRRALRPAAVPAITGGDHNSGMPSRWAACDRCAGDLRGASAGAARCRAPILRKAAAAFAVILHSGQLGESLTGSAEPLAVGIPCARSADHRAGAPHLCLAASRAQVGPQPKRGTHGSTQPATIAPSHCAAAGSGEGTPEGSGSAEGEGRIEGEGQRVCPEDQAAAAAAATLAG